MIEKIGQNLRHVCDHPAHTSLRITPSFSPQRSIPHQHNVTAIHEERAGSDYAQYQKLHRQQRPEKQQYGEDLVTCFTLNVAQRQDTSFPQCLMPTKGLFRNREWSFSLLFQGYISGIITPSCLLVRNRFIAAVKDWETAYLSLSKGKKTNLPTCLSEAQ